MGFGQYSAMGGCDRTKAGMLDMCSIVPAWSRKAGKNRVHYRMADGSQGFILHETIIATLSADGRTLTLNDGGWPSLTTRKAFSEAAAAFGLPELRASGGRPKAAHSLGFHGEVTEANPYGWHWGAITFDRTVTLHVSGKGYELAEKPRDVPLIRAFLDDGYDTCTVTYERRAFRSTTGDIVPATPKRALQLIHHVLRIAARGRGRVSFRREPLYQFSVELAGHDITPGRMGRTVHIGCHAFKVADLRNMLARLEADHPAIAADIAKEARKLARQDKRETEQLLAA